MKNENNYASCANYAFFKGDSRGQKEIRVYTSLRENIPTVKFICNLFKFVCY